MVIVLDYGHGGLNDKGEYVTAPSKMFTFKNGKTVFEGVLNRQIGNLIKKKLNETTGYKVLTTHGKNLEYLDISLQQRVALANKLNSKESIFISIHCNAGGGSGFEIYTSPGQTKSDSLATYIINEIKSTYINKNLPVRIDLSDKDEDKEEKFYVLTKTKSPAVLIEYGFFDSEKDIKFLEDSEFQKEIAEKTTQGIINYVNSLA